MAWRWVSEINGRLALDGRYLIEEKERKTREIHGAGVSTDQADLLAKAAALVKSAEEHLEREDYKEAWFEARRASRPLRILMNGLWINAIKSDEPRPTSLEEDIKRRRNCGWSAGKKMVGPQQNVPGVASPPLASFNTLPQHYMWVDLMKSARYGKNLVPSGNFDHPEA